MNNSEDGWEDLTSERELKKVSWEREGEEEGRGWHMLSLFKQKKWRKSFQGHDITCQVRKFKFNEVQIHSQVPRFSDPNLYLPHPLSPHFAINNSFEIPQKANIHSFK